MSLSAPTLSALQDLVAQDKALMARVQTTRNADQAAAIIAPAAARQGITVNEAELSAHLEAVSASLTNQALSDQQLETVAGGLNDDGRLALVSVFTLGFGCAFISIGHAVGGTSIDGTAKYLGKKFC